MSKPRVQVARHKRKKRIMKRAKGFVGGRGKLLRTAKETVKRAVRYSYRDRKDKKADFRRLWITRITAAVRAQDLSYSKFIHGLKKAGADLSRKMLSEMAISDKKGFEELVTLAKANL